MQHWRLNGRSSTQRMCGNVYISLTIEIACGLRSPFWPLPKQIFTRTKTELCRRICELMLLRVVSITQRTVAHSGTPEHIHKSAESNVIIIIAFQYYGNRLSSTMTAVARRHRWHSAVLLVDNPIAHPLGGHEKLAGS